MQSTRELIIPPSQADGDDLLNQVTSSLFTRQWPFSGDQLANTNRPAVIILDLPDGNRAIRMAKTMLRKSPQVHVVTVIRNWSELTRFASQMDEETWSQAVSRSGNLHLLDEGMSSPDSSTNTGCDARRTDLQKVTDDVHVSVLTQSELTLVISTRRLPAGLLDRCLAIVKEIELLSNRQVEEAPAPTHREIQIIPVESNPRATTRTENALWTGLKKLLRPVEATPGRIQPKKKETLEPEILPPVLGAGGKVFSR